MIDLDTVRGRNDTYCAGYEDGKAGRPSSPPERWRWDYEHGWEHGKASAKVITTSHEEDNRQ